MNIEDLSQFLNDNPSDEYLADDLLENDLFTSFNQGHYIGMMSGTSLDAMDAVIVSFNYDAIDNTLNKTTPIELTSTHSKDFPANLKTVLLALCQPNGTKELSDILHDNSLVIDDLNSTDINNMSELDWFGWASRAYGEFASEVILELLEKSGMSDEHILAIGCHGQTVRHRPQHGFTLQLVDPNIIAERTGISVVTDFRRRDMAVGGQGAPLVPAFHQAIFKNSTSTNNTKNHEVRILLNLGGIANITVLPDNDNAVTGYDTGPANLLMDAWAKLHTNHSYDDDGKLARSGTIIEPLLKQLLTHPFFAKTAPKSTGREDFHMQWLEAQLDEFSHHHPHVSFSPADIQATLTELTALSASIEIEKYRRVQKISNKNQAHVYVCGGGAYNHYLLDRLAHHLPDWQVMTTDALGLAPTWVESAAFAWLARQTLLGDMGNLPEVTGAKRAVVLGQVCFG